MIRILILALVGYILAPLAQAQPIVINLGTLAPQGSLWHQEFLAMGQQWRTISHGRVTLRIYPGGVQGDEPDMVKRLRIGQLQAAALSSAGLSEIDPAFRCLQIPMMAQSLEELDYIQRGIAPRLEKVLEARGFIVLNWGEVGWVHFFTKRPVTRLSELRKAKLFAWAGDNEEIELWRAAGFKPVPLAATNILTGLQTGMIDTFDTAPLAALSNQWFGLTKYMIDVKWGFLTAATIVARSTWNSVPEAERAEMLQAARSSEQRLRGEVRKLGDESVAAMQKRGLTVLRPDAAAMAEWNQLAEEVYPKLRGKSIPADMFDEVRRLRDDYRTVARSRGQTQ